MVPWYVTHNFKQSNNYEVKLVHARAKTARLVTCFTSWEPMICYKRYMHVKRGNLRRIKLVSGK